MRKLKVFIRIICLVFVMMFCGVALAEEVGAVSSETQSTETVVSDEVVTSDNVAADVSEVPIASEVAPTLEDSVNDVSSETPNTTEEKNIQTDSSDTEELTKLNDSDIKDIIDEGKEEDNKEANSTDAEEPTLLSEKVEEKGENIEEEPALSNISTGSLQDISSGNQVSVDSESVTSSTSSPYTVDFSANGVTYHIAGDSKKVKLSTILNNIDIAGDVSDVKVFMDEDCTEEAENGVVAVDGKTLFNVYKDEDGEWYVDFSNAFSSVHGLKVLLPDNKEYKIKVTDDGPVKYLDKDGSEQTCSTYTSVSGNSTDLGTTGTTSWYVLDSDISNNERYNVYGNVNLILMDGYQFENQGIHVSKNNSLTIYSQTASNSGSLVATAPKNYAGIGGNNNEESGEIYIYGGTIKVYGGHCTPIFNPNGGAGIGGGALEIGHVTISGGEITALGGKGHDDFGGEAGAAIGNGGGATGISSISINNVTSMKGGTDGDNANEISVYNGEKYVSIKAKLPSPSPSPAPSSDGSDYSEIIQRVLIEKIPSSELSEKQKSCADSITKDGRKAVNYIRCSLNGVFQGKANQSIKVKPEFLMGMNPSEVHIWYLDYDGTFKEAETSVCKDGSVLIQNGMLGYYLITD